MIDTDMCHREPVSVRVEELIRAFEDLVAGGPPPPTPSPPSPACPPP